MLHEYVGHLHLHSTYSDGTESIDDIASMAREAGLSFIGFNDHFHLEALRDGKEGWYDGVAVLIGCEINDFKNHFLAYNITNEVPNNAAQPQRVIDAVREQGGLGFIAHPFERSSPLWDKGRTFGWSDWQVQGFTGIEIWNFCSLWRANAPNLPLALWRYRYHGAARLDPLPETIAAWDRLSARRRVVAIGGSDNHGFRAQALFGLIPLRLFDYRIALRTVHTHVLLADEMPTAYPEAKGAILSALSKGMCFVALHLFEDPQGFRFDAETRRGIAQMDADIALGDEPVLRVDVPRRGVIRFIHDGRILSTSRSRSATMRARKPGSYRVEVRLPRRHGESQAWIYSNAIRVIEGTGHQQI